MIIEEIVKQNITVYCIEPSVFLAIFFTGDDKEGVTVSNGNYNDFFCLRGNI